MEEMGVIKNIEVLTQDFIPSRVVHRDGQLKAIRDNLKPVLRDQPPRNNFLYGDPGTGKTCIAQHVTGELKEEGIPVFYINCWESQSAHSILYNIVQKLGPNLLVHRKGTPVDEILETLKSKLKPYSVIILDEFDQLTDNKVIYDLINMKACLILIANSETALYDTDPRIRSRLASSENIHFPPYNTGEITEILKDRAEWGLIPGSVKTSQLTKIAELSQGDARLALDTLRISAERAESEGRGNIQDEHIPNISQEALRKRREESLGKLNPYQKIIHDIISTRKKIGSEELFREFQKQSRRQSLIEVTDRTYRKYLEKMAKYKIISFTGTDRWREYHIA